ncbi:hypothetical protein [Salinibacter altiplanensis]|uniref:hypothetical protein n=1 Tax=Salinibacter altiplanensis TaxID=1803181 RepID=UPI000C9F6CA7|nr:hypothetical protein [Salinibacter altiplanensis]
MSDAKVGQYYYIFDSRTHRPLVLDRATGEHHPPSSDSRGPLIDHVSTRQGPAVVRQFARWCARRVNPGAVSAHTAAGRLWAAAQRDAPDAWQRVRRDTADSVMLAMSLGLPQREPRAARLLTLQACTHPEAQQAAHDAAHMSERWAEFSAPSAPAEEAHGMRARHVDWLLDRLSSA